MFLQEPPLPAFQPGLSKFNDTMGESITHQDRFISDIVLIINEGRKNAYKAVNKKLVETYWYVGKRIVQEEQGGSFHAKYGTQLLKKLSEILSRQFGKGFTERNLRNFRQFYAMFPDYEIWHTEADNVTWSHFRCLLTVDNVNARYWYMRETSKENWNVRTLSRNIGSQYYFRMLQSKNKEKVVEEMKLRTAEYRTERYEFIKNPVVAEFLGLSDNKDFTESELEQSILTHLQRFLLELGSGYAFVARQKRISTDVGDFYIDLVFYNYLIKAFLLIDLKTSRISHQDVGQMDMYVRMFDELERTEGDNPTIGLILCTETSKDIAKYSVLRENQQLFAAKYLTYLPSQEELKREIEHQKEIFMIQQGLKKDTP